MLQRIRSPPPIDSLSRNYWNLLIDTFKYLCIYIPIMAKSVRVHIDRDEYNMLVKRFGNDGVRPEKCVLIHRAVEYMEDLESELAHILPFCRRVHND